MCREGVDHPDPIKSLANEPAIWVDSDGVDDPAGLGIREQYITQLGNRRLMGHGHAKPGEIAQVPHARDDCR
jgi:hypothetical protein